MRDRDIEWGDLTDVDVDTYRSAERAAWRAYGIEPTECVVDLPAAGTRMRVVEVGAGPALVFVHGTSSAGASWAPLIAQLDGYRCVVIDRPGCGLSEPTGNSFTSKIEHDRWADGFMADALDGLGIDRAHVVSTSLGGYFALRGAAAHPDRIASVFEVGWTVGAPVTRLPLVMRLGAVPGLGRLMLAVPPTRGMARSMLKQIGLREALSQGRVPDASIEWFLSMLRDTDTIRNEYAVAGQLFGPIKGLDESWLLPSELLEGITVPTGFAWGTDDLFGGAEAAVSLTGAIPSASLHLIEGAGHAPWLDDPQQVAGLFVQFHSSVERGE